MEQCSYKYTNCISSPSETFHHKRQEDKIYDHKKLQKVCKMQGRGRGLDIRRLTLARKVRDTEKKLLLSSFLCIINEAAAAGNQ